MGKKATFVLMCLLTSVILVACGPSQAELDAQATKIAADIFATQTAEAPTPTPTVPPTNTPTPMPMSPTATSMPPTATPTFAGITILGLITNLEDAERYLAEDSYLQLVRFPADGRLSCTTDGQGWLTYDSELAQIPIPHDGVFNFQVESLESGTYLIAAQRARNVVGSMSLSLLVKEAELVTVEIPQDADLPFSLDLGEVYIPVPSR